MPSADTHCERLRRKLEADPKDQQCRLEYFLARSRLEGTSVFMKILMDLELYEHCLPALQDMAINEVARRLAPEFQPAATTLRRNPPSSQPLELRIGSFVHDRTGLVFNLIPGGTFLMGTSTEQLEEEYEYCRLHYNSFGKNWVERETPQHEVSILPFLASRFPLTQEAWLTLRKDNPSRFKHPKNPLDRVSWHESKEWLEEAGGGLRLLSEAEWEYACRAGTSTRFFWGQELDDDYCWHTANSKRKTRAVTLHQDHDNAFGMVDMLGQVWEWCEDSAFPNYHGGPYDQEALQDPDRNRVLRGGCWGGSAGSLRTAYRSSSSADDRDSYFGFRAARSCPLDPLPRE